MEQTDAITLPDFSVLVVDDQLDNLVALEHVFSELGVYFRSATSAKDTLIQLDRQIPDLLLIDDGLEGGKGFELLEKIHSFNETSHVTVVMMTAHLSMGRQPEQRTTSLYPNGYMGVETLTKPINARVLTGMMNFYRQLKKTRQLVSVLHNNNDHLLEAKNEGVLAVDRDGGILFANNSACRLLAVKPSDLVGTYVESIFDKDHNSVISQWIEHPIAVACNNQHIVQVESAKFWCAHGDAISVKFAAVPIKESGDVNIVFAFQQISEATQSPVPEQSRATNVSAQAPVPKGSLNSKVAQPLSDAQISDAQKCAFQKGGTLKQKASGLLEQQDAGDGRKAFLLVDVDHFGHIESQLGRSVADEVLQNICERINLLIGIQGDWMQLEGDRFGIVTTYSDADGIAEHLVSAFRSEFKVMGHELYLGVSVALTMFYYPVDDIEPMLEATASVLNKIKQSGGGAHQWVSGHSPKELSALLEEQERLHLDKLKQALSADCAL